MHEVYRRSNQTTSIGFRVPVRDVTNGYRLLTARMAQVRTTHGRSKSTLGEVGPADEETQPASIAQHRIEHIVFGDREQAGPRLPGSPLERLIWQRSTQCLEVARLIELPISQPPLLS
jgi:hypothetical protein